MTTMSQAEKQEYLAGLHVGIISISRDGMGPLTVPIWYDYEPGGELWFITESSSRKGRLLSEGTRISLCAQSEDPPYKYVSIEGAITSISPASGETLPMAVRYLGDEMGKAYYEQTGGEGGVVVRVTPERWLAVDDGKSAFVD